MARVRCLDASNIDVELFAIVESVLVAVALIVVEAGMSNSDSSFCDDRHLNNIKSIFDGHMDELRTINCNQIAKKKILIR